MKQFFNQICWMRTKPYNPGERCLKLNDAANIDKYNLPPIARTSIGSILCLKLGDGKSITY